MALITKSKYITGLQCPKLLWITFNDPEKIPPVDPATQLAFDQGHEVGELAKKLYPGGIDIPYNDFKDSIAQTKKLLDQRKPLFEASVLAGGLYCRVDILNPVDGNAWDLIEIKSSSRVKDVNIADVSFQKYCCEKSGLKIRYCYLGFINTQYVRQGEVVAEEFFTVEDISERVDKVINNVPATIERFFETIELPACPGVDIGPHCTDPYECSLKAQCWAFLPDYNVFSLYYLGKKEKFKFLQQGILAIEDIPGDYKLTEKQIIQKECIEKNNVYVDKSGINAFLDTLEYPLYYLDFETFGPAIPPFDGARPYQQIPFQFSLHVVKSEGAKPEHYSFLAEGQGDTRLGFLSELKKHIGTKGDVIAYNAGFEKGVLNELSERFPGNESWIHNVLGRMKDLLDPFKAFDYYHPGQNGSASLKCVLPAVTGAGYEDMNISNGMAASNIFAEMFVDPLPEDQQNKVRKDLEDYCCLDTQAMVDIVNQLREISS